MFEESVDDEEENEEDEVINTERDRVVLGVTTLLVPSLVDEESIVEEGNTEEPGSKAIEEFWVFDNSGG